MALIESARDATAGQLNKAMDVVFPYIRTSVTKTERLSIGATAISQKWSDYKVVQITIPNVNTGGTGQSTYINSEFVWVVDYAKAAQDLQMALYGQSNIELDDANRTSPLDMLVSKNNSGSGSNSGGGSNSGSSGNSGSGGSNTNVTKDVTTTRSGSNNTTTTRGSKDTTTTKENVVNPTDTVVTKDNSHTEVTEKGDTPDIDIGDIV
jgi:hypothetical protein